MEKKKYTVVGTGYLTLDILLENKSNIPLELRAGGSFGNVMTILSYLGWNVYPISNLSNDYATQVIMSDLDKWNVNKNYIYRTQSGRTPLIIERLNQRRDKTYSHKFELFCPICKSRFPKYKSLSLEIVENILKSSLSANVFYFDRANEASITLAKKYKENGSLIYFEPSRISNPEIFSKCLRIVDILKYSEGTMDGVGHFTRYHHPPIEIQTLGVNGIRYRTSLPFNNDNVWKYLNGYKMSQIADSSGAGDWFSSGFIYYLIRNHSGDICKIKEGLLEDALFEGQILAALSCMFQGPRGLMYRYSVKERNNALLAIKKGFNVKIDKNLYSDNINGAKIDDVCKICSQQ